MIKYRTYNHKNDLTKIRDFLVNNHKISYPFIWTFERWNYAYYFVRKIFGITTSNWSESVGIWETGDGEISSIVNSEASGRGEAFFQINRNYLAEIPFDEMFEFAERNLALKKSHSSIVELRILEGFETLETIAMERGYIKNPDRTEITTSLDLHGKLTIPSLPQGFCISSMDIDDNTEKRALVFAKAFGNYGTDEEVKSDLYLELQKSPDYRRELDVFVVSPENKFVSFCLIWYDKTNQIGILEPVGTDPDYRRKSLGKAVVFEAINRVQNLGATKIIVGDGQQFYRSLCFETSHKYVIWTKEF